MIKYEIRKAIEADIPGIITLCVHHALYEQIPYSPEGKAEKLKNLLFYDTHQLHCLIVESEGEAIGYATFSKECSTWNAAYYIHMDCLYLEEAFRGHGIGQALVQEIVQFAKEIGANHLEWQTPTFNAPAIRFYKRLGAKDRDKVRFTLDI